MKEMVLKAVEELFAGGAVQEMVNEKVKSSINESLNDLFKSYGDGTKIIKDKLKEQIIPQLEGYDYDKHIIKLDAVLTEIIKKTTVDQTKLLENFKNYMSSEAPREITLEEIFDKYCDYCSENVSTHNLEHDGESYDYIQCSVNIQKDRFRDMTLTFKCDQYNDLEIVFENVYKNSYSDGYCILSKKELDIASLKRLNNFEILLLKIQNDHSKILITSDEIDDEGILEKEVEVKANPYE